MLQVIAILFLKNWFQDLPWLQLEAPQHPIFNLQFFKGMEVHKIMICHTRNPPFCLFRLQGAVGPVVLDPAEL